MEKSANPNFPSTCTVGIKEEEPLKVQSSLETPKNCEVSNDYDELDWEFDELVEQLTAEDLISADQEFVDLIAFYGCTEIELRSLRKVNEKLELKKEQLESGHSQQMKNLLHDKMGILKALEDKNVASEASVATMERQGSCCDQAVDVNFQSILPVTVHSIKAGLHDEKTEKPLDENNNEEPPSKTLIRRTSVKEMVSAFEEKAKEQQTSRRIVVKRFSSAW